MKNLTIMRAVFNRKVVFQEEKRNNQSTLYICIKHTLTEEPPLDVSAVRGGSSVEVDTVHPLSSSSPASSSLSLLLQTVTNVTIQTAGFEMYYAITPCIEA
ncbi:hypothetical protein T10_467 [Trichinella papuae]|uniref:Uncharacterized protein n=1 Tax=Trichinella papuae TaxID=268474 RepID=A0A0V1N6I4_9BILA|nr:hypothetical protein T10_467 [Trichinella papuae]